MPAIAAWPRRSERQRATPVGQANKHAISAPELAEVLLAEGRHTTGPLAARYLAGLADRGELAVGDPESAFRLLYGLVVSDSQIRVLLGERPPEDLEDRARQAVDRFLTLTVPQGHATRPPKKT